MTEHRHAIHPEIVKRTLIQDHLDRCLKETVGVLPEDRRGSIDGFRTTTKYL
ncbi:MAG TPA: hypothetical protein VGC14_01590 [Rhizobium sp.]